MASKRKIAIWASASSGIIVIAILIVTVAHRHRIAPYIFTGSVIQQNADTRKQSPIADVEITATRGLTMIQTKSDFSGLFNINWPAEAGLDQAVTLEFRHADYKPLDLKVVTAQKLYVVRMIPVHGEVEADLNVAGVNVSNVLIRYSTETTSTENVGTGVKTFQVLNTGDVPCDQHYPCSPDGKWKAAIASASLDAGEGNIFQDARLTCIAGPCPFTTVESNEFSKPARKIEASIRDWSDTTTFLLQAEVFRTQFVDTVRISYPVIFGRSMNFTLPPDARGPAIEAELNGTQIIFVLAPNPNLTWTDCEVRVEANHTKDYRCELKPGYRFQ